MSNKQAAGFGWLKGLGQGLKSMVRPAAQTAQRAAPAAAGAVAKAAPIRITPQQVQAAIPHGTPPIRITPQQLAAPGLPGNPIKVTPQAPIQITPQQVGMPQAPKPFVTGPPPIGHRGTPMASTPMSPGYWGAPGSPKIQITPQQVGMPQTAAAFAPAAAVPAAAGMAPHTPGGPDVLQRMMSYWKSNPVPPRPQVQPLSSFKTAMDALLERYLQLLQQPKGWSEKRALSGTDILTSLGSNLQSRPEATMGLLGAGLGGLTGAGSHLLRRRDDDDDGPSLGGALRSGFMGAAAGGALGLGGGLLKRHMGTIHGGGTSPAANIARQTEESQSKGPHQRIYETTQGVADWLGDQFSGGRPKGSGGSSGGGGTGGGSGGGASSGAGGVVDTFPWLFGGAGAIGTGLLGNRLLQRTVGMPGQRNWLGETMPTLKGTDPLGNLRLALKELKDHPAAEAFLKAPEHVQQDVTRRTQQEWSNSPWQGVKDRLKSFFGGESTQRPQHSKLPPSLRAPMDEPLFSHMVKKDPIPMPGDVQKTVTEPVTSGPLFEEHQKLMNKFTEDRASFEKLRNQHADMLADLERAHATGRGDRFNATEAVLKHYQPNATAQSPEFQSALARLEAAHQRGHGPDVSTLNDLLRHHKVPNEPKAPLPPTNKREAWFDAAGHEVPLTPQHEMQHLDRRFLREQMQEGARKAMSNNPAIDPKAIAWRQNRLTGKQHMVNASPRWRIIGSTLATLGIPAIAQWIASHQTGQQEAADWARRRQILQDQLQASKK